MDKAKEASYRIVSRREGWMIDHDGDRTGPYDMPEAALEAAFAAASLAVKERLDIHISLAFSEETRNADSPRSAVGNR
ncbi:hypothetical protein [Labrys monachus]|uniref:DUF2188 domain-containing protein n=1 Tax=Labrys monachus TaxID=217067 RepID=A0ABU0FLQ4_9HYPH|nr:hypothetical protein [Labrys monachus]MDQ0395532.1 hypothetical protein [Labrys monachus]